MAILVRAIDGMSNHTAADLRGPMADLLSAQGVVASGHLAVTPASPADMTVNVAAGVAYVLNDAWLITSDNVQKYWDVQVTAVANLAISSNPSGSTRIDLIILQVNDAAVVDANASNVATLVVTEGTPGAGAPALPDDALLLATITVVNGATTIDTAEIADNRTFVFTEDNIKSYASPIQTAADAATVTFDLGNGTYRKHKVTLGGNRTLAISNAKVGQVFIIDLIQDGTGSRTVTWFSTIKWAGGVAPTLTTTLNKIDTFGFIVTSAGNYQGYVVGQNL